MSWLCRFFKITPEGSYLGSTLARWVWYSCMRGLSQGQHQHQSQLYYPQDETDQVAKSIKHDILTFRSMDEITVDRRSAAVQVLLPWIQHSFSMSNLREQMICGLWLFPFVVPAFLPKQFILYSPTCQSVCPNKEEGNVWCWQTRATITYLRECDLVIIIHSR